MKRKSDSTAKTGWVRMKSAPASAFRQVRLYSRSGSIAFGSAPTPISARVGAFNGFPPRSTPRFIRFWIPTSPMESTSKTPELKGYSPSFGGSPVMKRML